MEIAYTTTWGSEDDDVFTAPRQVLSSIGISTNHVDID